MRAILAVAALVWSGPVVAQDAELASALAPAHKQRLAQSASSFNEITVKSGLAAKRFKLVTPFQDDLVLNSYENKGRAGFFYRQGILKLQFVGIKIGGEQSSKYTVFEIGGRNETGKPYQGSNAYGAATEVSVIGIYRDGIAALSAPSTPYDVYAWEAALSPSEAKAIALDIDALIEGEYASLSASSDVDCDGWRRKPKLDDPVDVLFQTCFIGAVRLAKRVK